jgi:hypothetical protein
MTSEVFKVGVALTLASNAEQVLGVMGSRLLGVHVKAQDLEKQFDRVKLAIGGAFALGGAKAMLDIMGKLIAKGAELENTLYKLQTAGFTPKEVGEIKRNATKVASQFPNLTEGELVKLTGETTAVYGDAKVAIKNLPAAAAYLSAVKYRHPEDPTGAAATADDAIFKILRSEEMRGLAQNPAEVKRALAATLKGQEVFGEQFDPTVSFQAVKYGRLASRYLSDRFLEGPGLIMAQELGGSNFGNSLNQVMQALIGGHITKGALVKLEEIKLVDRKKVKYGPHGSFDISNAIPEPRLLQTETDVWFRKHFATKVDAYTGGDTAKRDQVIRQIFFRTTGQQMAELLGWQTGPGGRITKDVERLGLAMSPEQAVALHFGNLATTTQDLNTQFGRLLTNLGQPAAHVAGKAAGIGVGPLKRAADAAAQHPGGSGLVDAAGGVLGVGLGGAGIGWLYKAVRPLLQRAGLLKGAAAEGGLIGDAGRGVLSKVGPGAARLIGGIGRALAGAASAVSRIGPGALRVLSIVGRGIAIGAEAVTGVVGAIAALPTAAIIGIVAGITALGLAIYEAYKHWDSSKGAADNLKSEIGALADFIVQKAHEVGGATRSLGVPPPPMAGQTVVVQHTTTLNGKVLLDEVSKHLAKAFDYAHMGTGRHDPAASLPAAAHNGGR